MHIAKSHKDVAGQVWSGLVVGRDCIGVAGTAKQFLPQKPSSKPPLCLNPSSPAATLTLEPSSVPSSAVWIGRAGIIFLTSDPICEIHHGKHKSTKQGITSPPNMNIHYPRKHPTAALQMKYSYLGKGASVTDGREVGFLVQCFMSSNGRNLHFNRASSSTR